MYIDVRQRTSRVLWSFLNSDLEIWPNSAQTLSEWSYIQCRSILKVSQWCLNHKNCLLIYLNRFPASLLTNLPFQVAHQHSSVLPSGDCQRRRFSFIVDIPLASKGLWGGGSRPLHQKVEPPPKLPRIFTAFSKTLHAMTHCTPYAPPMLCRRTPSQCSDGLYTRNLASSKVHYFAHKISKFFRR